jgi:phosphatidylserine decarboxylase
MGQRRAVDGADPPTFATVREGLPYVAALGLLALPLWRARPPLGGAVLAAAAGLAAFFRDPVRPLAADPDLLYAPADGVVIGIDRVERPWFLDGPAMRIGVFLSIFDVHVNRSPAAGRIVDVRDIGGGFRPAMHFSRSHGNRRSEIAVATSHGRLLVVQVAGLMARRIVSWRRGGDVVRAGQKLGMITFGSRTDLLVPIGRAEPLVSVGDRVTAARTPIARWL